jgi:pectin methylesterase-like acyl-CoA thioesterase
MTKTTWILSVLVACAAPATAQTFVAGTCKPRQPSFTTIQAAVKAAASTAGATVLVCPGTYPEQLVITTPLTLKGVSAPPLANPTIVPPSGGMTNGAIQPAMAYYGIAALISVDTGGSPGRLRFGFDRRRQCPER